MAGTIGPRRLVAIAGCALVGVIGWLGAPAMMVAGLLVLVLVAVIVTDERTSRSREHVPESGTA
jgi:Flp pilus assembly protein TadB